VFQHAAQHEAGRKIGRCTELQHVDAITVPGKWVRGGGVCKGGGVGTGQQLSPLQRAPAAAPTAAASCACLTQCHCCISLGAVRGHVCLVQVVRLDHAVLSLLRKQPQERGQRHTLGWRVQGAGIVCERIEWGIQSWYTPTAYSTGCCAITTSGHGPLRNALLHCCTAAHPIPNCGTHPGCWRQSKRRFGHASDGTASSLATIAWYSSRVIAPDRCAPTSDASGAVILAALLFC